MIPGWPNTQTSLLARTAVPPIGSGNVVTTDQLCPFQRSTRDPAPTSVNAHTSDGDVATAATTLSPRLPGNLTSVQVLPWRCHAVGPLIPSNAQPVAFPVAIIAVKSPFTPLCTDLTMCHDGGGAAVAAVTLPNASSPAIPAAIPINLPDMSCLPIRKPIPLGTSTLKTSEEGGWMGRRELFLLKLRLIDRLAGARRSPSAMDGNLNETVKRRLQVRSQARPVHGGPRRPRGHCRYCSMAGATRAAI